MALRGKKNRTTQVERSRRTRRKLVEAALDCVAELGYLGATMDRVVAKAGVSRGAQGHHFPTKSRLMQAAMTHMLDQLIEDLRHQTELIRRRKSDPPAVFRHLWDKYFSSWQFTVTMEFIVAARMDAELRQALRPVTEQFHQQIDDCFYLLCRGSGHQDARLIMAVNLTMSLLRGMGVQTVLYDRPAYFTRMLDEWMTILNQILDPEFRSSSTQKTAQALAS